MYIKKILSQSAFKNFYIHEDPKFLIRLVYITKPLLPFILFQKNTTTKRNNIQILEHPLAKVCDILLYSTRLRSLENSLVHINSKLHSKPYYYIIGFRSRDMFNAWWSTPNGSIINESNLIVWVLISRFEWKYKPYNSYKIFFASTIHAIKRQYLTTKRDWLTVLLCINIVGWTELDKLFSDNVDIACCTDP